MDCLKSQEYDLLLTDIQMPSADGFSVLAAVRGVDSAIPVVAVSARGEMDAGDFSARGFAGCLRKPFTANELVAVLNTVCGADAAVAPVGCGVAAAGAEQADGVDFSALTAYAGDDTAAARGILESFAEQGAANCALLERALDEGDTAALKAVAHKMAPIFTMLGAVQVAAALRVVVQWLAQVQPVQVPVVAATACARAKTRARPTAAADYTAATNYTAAADRAATAGYAATADRPAGAESVCPDG